MSAAVIAGQLLVGALEIYRLHANKPPGWRPSDAEWDDLEKWSDRTPEAIKREARERAPRQPPTRKHD